MVRPDKISNVPQKMHMPQNVFCPNLHLMAPFEALDVGCCLEFRCASFVFSSPRADFGSPRVGKWDPRVRFWDFQVDIVGRGRF